MNAVCRASVGSSWCVLAVIVAGCGDPLVDAAVVAGPRVIAATVSVDEEPERAQPRPGENFSVAVRVVSNDERHFEGQLRLCRARATTLGVPQCAGDAFELAEAEGSDAAALVFPLTMDRSLDAGDEWLLFGAVCDDAAPQYSGRSASFNCEDGTVPLEFSLRGEIPGGSEESNHNPEVGDAVRFDGQDWRGAGEALSPGAPCDELDVPRMRRGRLATIQWQVDPLAAEPIEADPEQYGATFRESLLLAHMATVPGLERAFSAFSFDEPITELELTLEVSRDRTVTGEGELAFFYTVARDGRGGSYVVERAFCVLP